MENSEYMTTQKNAFRSGIQDGIPIGLGYAAVSFSLGIAMRSAGMTWYQGFLLSLVNLASAGQYAGLQVISADAAYLEIVLVTLVANARYLLMSTALSQKFSQKTPYFHRFFVSYAVTDELFGIAAAQNGFLDPLYYYGAMSMAVPGWCIGTALGIIAGNILPGRIVSALSVALYGMFLAIILPPARKDRAVAAVVLAGFVLSTVSGVLPVLKTMTAGTKTILLTLLIAGTAASLCPHREDDHDA